MLIVTGDVDPDAVTQSAWSRRWAAGKAATRAQAQAGICRQAGAGRDYLVDKPGAVQSVINVGRHWVDRRDPRYFATLVGNHLLGEDFLSRLNKNLREDHGYTYGAGSAFDFRRSRQHLAQSRPRCGPTPRPRRSRRSSRSSTPSPERSRSRPRRSRRPAPPRRGAIPEEFESPSGIAGALSEIAEFNLPADYLQNFLPSLEASPRPRSRRA